MLTPIARAAIWKAPGRRSPSWPRSSSAWTVPLLIICETASSAPSASDDDRPRVVAALLTAVKMSRVAWPSSDVPRADAESFRYEPDTDSRSRPSWRAVLRTNSISRPTESAPLMAVNAALNLTADASASISALPTCWMDAIAPPTLRPTPSAPRASRAVLAAFCMSPAAPVTTERACCMSDCSREMFAAMSISRVPTVVAIMSPCSVPAAPSPVSRMQPSPRHQGRGSCPVPTE